MKDRFIKTMIVVVAILLLLNLFHRSIISISATEANAKSSQVIEFRGNGVSITCSEDGKNVYAASSSGIIRSRDFGKAGSWERVVENK